MKRIKACTDTAPLSGNNFPREPKKIEIYELWCAGFEGCFELKSAKGASTKRNPFECKRLLPSYSTTGLNINSPSWIIFSDEKRKSLLQTSCYSNPILRCTCEKTSENHEMCDAFVAEASIERASTMSMLMNKISDRVEIIFASMFSATAHSSMNAVWSQLTRRSFVSTWRLLANLSKDQQSADGLRNANV